MLRILRSNVSFSRQLSTTFVIGILVLALVSSLLISWLVSEAARNHFMSVGMQMTEHFASQSRLALLYASVENAESPARTIRGVPDIDGVSIFFPNGEVLYSEGGGDSEDTSWRSQLGEHAMLVSESAEDWCFAAKVMPSEPVEVSPFGAEARSDELLGYVLVTVGKDTLYAMTNRIFVINAIISMTLASLLLVILRLITKRLTTPLENLREIMRRAEQGETGIRTDLEGSRDIKDMEHSFNKMMGVLEEREQELKEARDAALETARAKAEFAAMVSHEIRTPLNGVIGMLHLINEIGVPERQRDYLNVAISSGDTLLSLINDILDFSKIEAGKLELESISFNLRECLEDVVGLFAKNAQGKNLELCLDVPADLPLQVAGDILRLRQVLTNLVSNALKFTEAGQVLLAVSVIRADEGHLQLEFAVEDTGIGIPLESQKRIFDSFRQADGSTSRRFGGTGLGLAICKQLIELLGGQLQLESANGLGSRFFFNIELQLEQPSAVDPLLAGQRVLVLDSNEHNLSYMGNCLRVLGCDDMVLFRELPQLNVNDAIADGRFNICFVSDNLSMEDGQDSLEFLRNRFADRIEHYILLTQPSVKPSDSWLVDSVMSRPLRLSSLRRCLSDLLLEAEKSKPQQKRLTLQGKKSKVSVKILIVDDNRTNQLVAKAMLSESGYQADVAANGEEALQLVEKGEYGLILMDCNMPVMDGYEATRRIRELPGSKGKTFIFAMTAVDNQEDVRRCHDVGMDDFLLKPLNLENLRHKLESLFDANGSDQNELPNAVTQTNDAFIDEESLTNLEKAMGSKVADIIEAFLADTPGYINDLKHAWYAGDLKRMGSIAHSLKGSSRNLGANLFASVCREIEERISGQELSQAMADSLMLDMERDYAQVEMVLRDKLGEFEVSKRKRASKESNIVLIVDDDRSTRLTIAHCLEHDGLWLEHASNGQVAIDRFLQLKPDLIIMDAVMPVVDGFDASLEIKRLPGGRTTPILMITALENDESVEKAFRCGAADFIPKPINLAVLRQRVRRVLDARQSEQRVKDLAYNDSLTGLPNRIAFSDRLQQDLAYAKRNGNQLAVMFVDVDHFKDVNDNLGHAAGDELLKVLAERVLACIRSEDTLARLGGDEFVVVLSAVHRPEGADIAAQNILNALTSPFQISGREVYIGASIGIAIFPDDGYDRDTLLKNADTAMYRAKALGRNNYQFYTEEMSTSISERVDMETDLHKVVQNNELEVYFHPKVNATTDALLGAEALVRWNHPRKGFLLPDAFIPIAEESGMIDAIGRWVMQRSCEQFQQWRNEYGYDGSLAVNVSPRQFMEARFLDDVRQCLQTSGLDPNRLELEITESAILDNVEQTIEKLQAIRELGVKIAIDDFGVGYSSFNYLKQMPVDVLKIDRSFIHDIPDDSSGAAIIDGIIRLAHNLQLEVVAEGVENDAQYNFLKVHNCDTIQGNVISCPLPAAGFFEKYISARLAQGI